MFVWQKTYDDLKDYADELRGDYYDVLAKVDELQNALNKILEQQTKSANATVKRMVKIAEEALGIDNDEGTTTT